MEKFEKTDLKREKRILFISRTVPPIMGSHGRRVINILKNLEAIGWKLDVLSASSDSNYPLYDAAALKMIPDSIRIFRVNSGFISKKYYNYNNSGRIAFKNNLFNRLIKKLRFYIFESNVIYLLDWTPRAILKGHCLSRANQYDILISSGLSQAPIIACIIKLFNKNIPWIIDYGDPWVFSPTYRDDHSKFKFIFDRWIEKQILRYANMVVVTTEETKELYLNHFKFLNRENIVVIPMGIDIDLFLNSKSHRSSKFRILYTGSIYPTQDIYPFLDAMQVLIKNKSLIEKVEILFIGNIDINYINLVNDKHLDKLISFEKFLPYEEIIPLIKGADILLAFGAKGGLQVPGKLFDYLGSNRPILWLKADENDAALKYFLNLSHITVINNTKFEIYTTILQLINRYMSNNMNEDIIDSNLSNNSWYSRVCILNEICMRLISSTSHR